MAQFNIDAHLGSSKQLEWLALPEGSETPASVLDAVRKAAAGKFGQVVMRKRWSHKAHSNGMVAVRMHA